MRRVLGTGLVIGLMLAVTAAAFASRQAAAADVTGSIEIDGSALTVTISEVNQNASVTFSGTAGQQLGLGLSSVSISGGYLSVRKPDGSNLLSQQWFATSGGEYDLAVLPVDGTYTIFLDPSGSATGSVTLTLSADVTSAIEIGGASQTVTVSRLGQNGRLSFEGTAGQRLGLGVTGVSMGSSCCSAYLSVWKPDGSKLYPASGSDLFGTSGKAIELPALPASGTYSIFVDPYQVASTGSATFTLSEEATGTIVVGGDSATLTLSRPGQNGRLSFEGAVGERLGLGVTQVTMGSGCCSAYVTVRKPDGTQLHPASGSEMFGTTGGEFDFPVLPSSGTYTIHVKPYSVSSTGSATYTLSGEVTSTISVGGASETMTFARVGQNGRLTFEGTAGQLLGLGTSGVSMGSTSCCAAYFTISNPDGSRLFPASGSEIFGNDGNEFDLPALPASGTYTIALDPYQTVTGSATFTLSEEQTETIAIGGDPETMTFSRVGENGSLSFTAEATQPLKVTVSGVTIGSTSCCGAIGRIRRPDGSTLNWNYFGTSGGTLTATASTSGTHTLFVDPQQANIGDITLALTQNGAWQDPEQCWGTMGDGGVHGLCPSNVMSDPVNTLTGAFTESIEDLALPGTGVSFAWVRSYTSADATAGPLGPGWTFSYGAALTVQPNGDVLLRGDEGQRLLYMRQSDGSFVGPGGASSTLTETANGYELVRHDQVVYAFDGQGRLTSILDRNQQGLTLAYDGSGRLSTITDAAGREAPVSYNAEGLISEVSLAGRSVSYGYASGRLSSVTDVRGKTWTYTYDGGGRLATVVDPLGHPQISNVYGGDGRVTSQTDALGKTTTFAWDAATQIATVTDPTGNVWKDDYDNNVLAKRIDGVGNVTEFGHDSDLNETSVKAPDGQQTTMSYDSRGNLLQAVAPPSLQSATKAFTYDTDNNVLSVTDARGKVTTYGYDASGNNTSVVQDGQTVAEYTYNGDGQVTSTTDGRGKTTAYTYDANGSLASVTDPLGNETTYGYDAAGRTIWRVDPRGNVAGADPEQFKWTYTYDAAGNLLSETDPLGNTTSYSYDDAGKKLTETDANDNTTTYAYDAANRLVSVTTPDAGVTSYTYDDAGNKLTETDPRGKTTSYGYDDNNRLTSVTTPLGNQTTYFYDANGNQTKVVDPRGNVLGANADDYATTYMYDLAGRLLSETDPLGNTTSYAYDKVGNRTFVTDANNHTTSYAYDGLNRLTSVTAPGDAATTFSYDGNGNMLTRTDANGHVTSYAYDDANRLTSMTRPLTRTWVYSYDANANLTKIVDANGNETATAGDGTTARTYDRANRLTEIDFSDATPDVSFAYDAVGNRTSMSDGAGTQTYAYDPVNRVTEVSRGTDTFAYLYDLAGNITRRTYPDGTIIDHGYDDDGRLDTVTSGGNTTTYTYDPAANLTTTTLPSANGYVEERSYDRVGRLTRVNNTKGGVSLSDFSYTLDRVGNPTQLVRAGSLALTETYEYDVRDRLTAVCYATNCAGASDYIKWTYDPVGNRVTEERPAGTTNYTYNAADELTQAGTTSYGYDANGNQTSAGSETFTYELADRLKSTTLGGATTYSYDGDGNRLQASASGQVRKYVWDMSHELPLLALERDGVGATLRRYLYGDRRISLTSSGTTSYYHHDPLGSLAGLTSATGVVQWSYAYEPYGLARSQSQDDPAAPANPMRYAGELLDATGLYNLRARQYSPSIGRFLTLDPAAPSAFAAASSSYTYAGARPTVMIDPSGATFVPSDAALRSMQSASSPAWKRPPRPRFRPPWVDLVTWLVDQFNDPTFDEMEVDWAEAVVLTERMADVPRETAIGWVNAFRGRIYMVSLDKGAHFVRYYSDVSEGRWLTRERFSTPTQAIRALNLPKTNGATCRQDAWAAYSSTEGLRGTVAGGRPPGTVQWMIFRYKDRIRFGRCIPWKRWG